MSELWDKATGIERLATGATWLEGPSWSPWGILVSDIPNNRILRWSEGDVFDVFATDVEFTNGRTASATGEVYQCSHGRRAIEQLFEDGSTKLLVDHYGDARLNSPNDITIGPDGALWFTDPPYGIVQEHEGHLGEREYGDNFVFRYEPDTRELRPVVTDIEEPNGLAFSPDGKTLYVSDTSAALQTDGLGNRCIRAYDVMPDARCKNGRLFATMTDGLSDGFRVDAEGRVWTSHGPSISIIDATGVWLETIEMPELVGNLCFAGNDLFVAASTSLYRLYTFTTDASRRAP